MRRRKSLLQHLRRRRRRRRRRTMMRKSKSWRRRCGRLGARVAKVDGYERARERETAIEIE